MAHNTGNRTFPAWLKERRRDAGLSYAALGELAGMSAAGVQKVENGGNPTLDSFERLCEALGATPGDYYGVPRIAPLPSGSSGAYTVMSEHWRGVVEAARHWRKHYSGNSAAVLRDAVDRLEHAENMVLALADDVKRMREVSRVE